MKEYWSENLMYGCETHVCIGQDRSSVRAVETDKFNSITGTGRIRRIKNDDVKRNCEEIIKITHW